MSDYNRDSALQKLLEGNARFMADRPQAWQAGSERRKELAPRVQPFACIVTCSDPRVSPEIVFDQSVGDLFAVRLAGNPVTDEVIASVEFAIAVFDVPLVVVMGHTQCAAVQAALQESRHPSAYMRTLLSHFSPACTTAQQASSNGDDLLTHAIRENARQGVKELVRRSESIAAAATSSRVNILSALYELHSGQVVW